MAYEINISKNGKHYFATHERSIGHSATLLKELHEKFKVAFPESEGYKITASDISIIGQGVDLDNI